MASLRDANGFPIPHPVVSLRSTTGYRLASLRDAVWWVHRPVVSLRSTTGYTLRSRRDQDELDLSDAGGIPSCSRWLSKTTPPETIPPQSAPRQGCQLPETPPPSPASTTPFNVSKIDKERLAGDPRYPFGIPRTDNGNYLWVFSMVSKLSRLPDILLT